MGDFKIVIGPITLPCSYRGTYFIAIGAQNIAGLDAKLTWVVKDGKSSVPVSNQGHPHICCHVIMLPLNFLQRHALHSKTSAPTEAWNCNFPQPLLEIKTDRPTTQQTDMSARNKHRYYVVHINMYVHTNQRIYIDIL